MPRAKPALSLVKRRVHPASYMKAVAKSVCDIYQKPSSQAARIFYVCRQKCIQAGWKISCVWADRKSGIKRMEAAEHKEAVRRPWRLAKNEIEVKGNREKRNVLLISYI